MFGNEIRNKAGKCFAGKFPGHARTGWPLENNRATIGRQQSGTIGQADDQIAIGRPFGEARSAAIWTSIPSGNRVLTTIGHDQALTMNGHDPALTTFGQDRAHADQIMLQ